MKQKILALLLALAVVASLCAVSAMAEDAIPESPASAGAPAEKSPAEGLPEGGEDPAEGEAVPPEGGEAADPEATEELDRKSVV